MPTSVKLVLIATALIAAYFDLRVRRIPNWINVSGVFLGLALNSYMENWQGTRNAAEGLLLALVIYIPLYALKGMGAGDVKLMAAIGALAGPGNWLNIFLITALLGGIVALMLVVLRGKLPQTIMNVALIVTHLSRGKQPVQQNDALSIHHKNSLKMPHGAIIACGVFLFLFFGLMA